MAIVETALLSTGLESLDRLLRGGLPRGAWTVLCGPSGAGKTALARQIAAELGNQAVFFVGPACAANSSPDNGHRLEMVDLGGVALTEGLAATVPLVRRKLSGRGYGLAVFDNLALLFTAAGDRLAYASWFHGIGAVLAEQQVAGLALVSTTAQLPLGLISEAATMVIEVRRGDGTRPRTLVFSKTPFAEPPVREQAFRLTPLGISFEPNAGLLADVPPVTGLGSRILGALRTARRLTGGEVAMLLNEDPAAVQAATVALVEDGYVVAEDIGGQIWYRLPSLS